MLISLFRVLKYTFIDFWRNFWLSFITITMIIFALASVNFLLLLQLISQEIVDNLEKKVDVSVFFNPNANDNQIYEVESTLLTLPQVKDVKIVSKDEALELFKARYKKEDAIMKSIEELGFNPLGATLSIKAKSAKDFPVIIEVLNNPKFAPIIAEKDFSEHEAVILKIASISEKVKTVGLGISLIFIFIAGVIVFNTIRIALYTHRDEIKIMKLVGAGDWFIKGPYLLQGVLFSFIGCAAVVAILYPLMQFIQPYLFDFIDGSSLDLVAYFNKNFIKIFGFEFLAASVLSIVSGLVATARYLKV